VNRQEFEHVLRAAADVVRDELVVVGSQAILAGFPNAPPSLLRSQEVDVYPRSEPERAQEIDGAIGDGSMFHSTYGYYAHGVGPETIQAPAGWEERLERLDLPAIRKRDSTIVAWCLEVHDLVLAKLAAGRAHDLAFARDAIREGLVDVDMLRRGVELSPREVQRLVEERLEGTVAQVERQRAT
jgi:Nucleotidyltransferase of unknown function (DUF6036)